MENERGWERQRKKRRDCTKPVQLTMCEYRFWIAEEARGQHGPTYIFQSLLIESGYTAQKIGSDHGTLVRSIPPHSSREMGSESFSWKEKKKKTNLHGHLIRLSVSSYGLQVPHCWWTSLQKGAENWTISCLWAHLHSGGKWTCFVNGFLILSGLIRITSPSFKCTVLLIDNPSMFFS